MGGRAKGGLELTLSQGTEVATGILEELDMGGFIVRGEVAGSIRRGKATVGDVDLVVVPVEGMEGPLRKVLQTFLHGLSGHKVIKGLTEEGVQVDVYIATEANYGAALFTWTGPMDFNKRVRGRAKGMGLKLNQYGLWDDDELLAASTEDDMFDTLDMEWQEPAHR